MNILKASVATLAVCLAIMLKYSIFFLNTFGGRLESTPKTAWANHGNLNNDNCWKNTAGQACEDVKIHSRTNTAFLACGNPRDRLDFYPGAVRHNSAPDRYYLEYFVKYDIETNITTRLRVENWNSSRDLVLHGLDIWESKSDPSKTTLFAVNHDRRGESILLFSHTLGTSTIRLVEDFTHPLIKTPNEIAAAGPRAFFISNDHYYYNGMSRRLEDKYGPFRWASQVVYCADTDPGFDCKIVSPRNAHPYANGILLVDEGKTLMVNDVIHGSVTAYDIDTETKVLTPKQTIDLGAAPDNLSEDPVAGDLIVSVIPNVTSAFARASGDNLLNDDAPVEAAVLRLVKAKNYAPEILFWDDGSLISILTGSAVSTEYGKLVVGGAWGRHFVVCDVET